MPRSLELLIQPSRGGLRNTREALVLDFGRSLAAGAIEIGMNDEVWSCFGLACASCRPTAVDAKVTERIIVMHLVDGPACDNANRSIRTSS